MCWLYCVLNWFVIDAIYVDTIIGVVFMVIIALLRVNFLQEGTIKVLFNCNRYYVCGLGIHFQTVFGSYGWL